MINHFLIINTSNVFHIDPLKQLLKRKKKTLLQRIQFDSGCYGPNGRSLAINVVTVEVLTGHHVVNALYISHIRA